MQIDYFTISSQYFIVRSQSQYIIVRTQSQYIIVRTQSQYMSQKFRKFITVSLHFNHNTQQIDYYTSQFDQNTSQFDDDQINIMIHHGRLVINISQQYL